MPIFDDTEDSWDTQITLEEYELGAEYYESSEEDWEDEDLEDGEGLLY